jgi:hypothetical protein
MVVDAGISSFGNVMVFVVELVLPDVVTIEVD